MFKKTQVMRGVLFALGGALVAGGALAQATDRVEITGSRIKTLDAVTNSPVLTVTAADLNSSQPVAVEEVVKTLAAAVPAIGPGTNNGAGGGATVDLRGLGSNRSLVLINGRRLVPFNLLGSVDTNTIPIGLLDRVELVTGGASTVYGADAVTGVMNFILRKNFNGVEVSTNYGLSERGDAHRYRVDATIGAALADGRGNVVLSLGKTVSKPLKQGERDLGLSALIPMSVQDEPICGML